MSHAHHAHDADMSDERLRRVSARNALLARELGINRVDPTGTKTLRAQYVRQLNKRWRALKRLNRAAIVDDRILVGHQDEQDDDGDSEGTVDVDDITGDDDDDRPTPRPEPSDPPDVPSPLDPTPSVVPSDPSISWDARDYLEWYSDAQQRVLFGPPTPDGGNWSDDYIRYAYEKGVSDADVRMQRIGVTDGETSGSVSTSLRMPVHQNAIDSLRAQNRELLEEIGAANVRELDDVLTDAILSGDNPRETARVINDRIDAVGAHRSRVHARTAIVGAYNDASLTRYGQQLGEDSEVTMMLEFTTASDDRVCAECASKGGDRKPIHNAAGIIPVHPQCRCIWLPVEGE